MNRSKMDTIGVVVILAIGIIFFVGGNLVNYAMISEAALVDSIEQQGFQNVTISEKGTFFANFHGCSGEHAIYAKFSATNGTGQKVYMTACRGGIFPGSAGLSIRSK
jgi:hypothetical protein